MGLGVVGDHNGGEDGVRDIEQKDGKGGRAPVRGLRCGQQWRCKEAEGNGSAAVGVPLYSHVSLPMASVFCVSFCLVQRLDLGMPQHIQGLSFHSAVHLHTHMHCQFTIRESVKVSFASVLTMLDTGPRRFM